MADTVNNTGYGYASDESTGLNLKFGLNPAAARLVKFEWINNGGKDGAEGEALDIQFSIVGSDRTLNYRLFPVTKAFLKDNSETTDPASPEFQKEVRNFNSLVTHILHCFRTDAEIKTAFSAPIANFKDFCKIAMSLLPKDTETIPLDIFVNWQYQITGENKQTYLTLPKKMSYGKWLCKAVTPVGEWKEVVHPSPDNNTPVALKFVDEANNIHPFVRNGWFMTSPFSYQQKVEESEDVRQDAPETTEDAPNAGAENKGAW